MKKNFVKGKGFYLLAGCLVLFLVTGCSMISYGRFPSISFKDLDKIKAMETTKDDVVSMLGEPQKIIYKSDNIEVYIYIHSVNRSLAIPFLISLGRTASSGQNLVVTFQYDKVLDYEFTVDQAHMSR